MNKKRIITIVSSALGVIAIITIAVFATSSLMESPATTATATSAETVVATKTATPTPTIKPTTAPTPTVSVTPTPTQSTTTSTETAVPNGTQTAAQPKETQAAPKETQAAPPPTETAAPPPPTTTAPPPTETQAPPPPTQAAYVPNLDNIKNLLISMYQSSGQWNPNGTIVGDDSMSLAIQARTSDEAFASYYYNNKYGGNTAMGIGISSVSITSDGTYIYITTSAYSLNG